MKIFEHIHSYEERVAVKSNASEFKYGYLIEKSDLIASFLLNNKQDLNEERIGLLMSPDINYICTLWGIWKAGGVAVPLSLSAKKDELKHCISDCNIKLIITSDLHEEQKVIPTDKHLNVVEIEELNIKEKKQLPSIKSERKAMILYTSGTTNKPKGVVTTHMNVESQITTLVEAWEWNQEDHIPLFLPLHHIHGIINSLSCALFIGAKVTMMGPFDTEKVCSQVASNDFKVFTAVPTIYFSLIEKLESSNNKKLLEGFKKMRLMMSGSAALAPEIHKKWKELTGKELLERYGMTEVGMALSNKINGEKRPGSVGVTLPGVEVKIVDDNGNVLVNEGEVGQLLIKGPQVFLEYLNQPDKTKESFKGDWFLSGDIVMLERGYYKILGRDSVDIIKSGGYKISALEIEDVLLKNTKIRECAVVGIKDDKWGEIVASGIVFKEESLNIDEITEWCSNYLSDYKIPRKIIILDDLPKNSMGKVTKPALKQLFLSK